MLDSSHAASAVGIVTTVAEKVILTIEEAFLHGLFAFRVSLCLDRNNVVSPMPPGGVPGSRGETNHLRRHMR